MADDVNIEELAQLTESYTGADLAGLVRQASLQALKNSIVIDGDNDSSDAALQVHNVHFTQAIKNLRPSVTPQVCLSIYYHFQTDPLPWKHSSITLIYRLISIFRTKFDTKNYEAFMLYLNRHNKS